MRLIDADALTEFLKCLLPKRGMWEIEGDTAKDAICETVAEAIEMVKNMETIQPVATDTNAGSNSEIPNSSDCISRQAAIDALQKCRKHCIDPFDSYHIDIQDAEYQLSKVPTAQSEPQWIPCSERLPEDEYVLISKKPSKISGDKWCVAIAIRTADTRSRKVQWRDSGFGIIPDDKVLAWMPLPEPYREGAIA